MKKGIIAVLGIIMVLSLVSCKKKEENQAESTGITTESQSDQTSESSTEEVTQGAEEGTETGQPQSKSVSIYRSNAEATGLVEEQVDMEEITAEKLIKELIRVKILESDSELKNFEIKGDMAILDLTTVPSYGTSGESILLTAIGNTFTKAFQVEKVRLLIDGKNYSSGHIEFTDTDYLKFEKNFKVLD